MTTTVENDIGLFYVNDPLERYSIIDTKLWLKSQYSQTIEGPYSIASIEETTRYARFTVNFPTGWDEEHKNGFYTYYIGKGAAAQPDIIYHEDIVKIITDPGGDAGEQEYISNNETRKADVYYQAKLLTLNYEKYTRRIILYQRLQVRSYGVTSN